MSLNRMRSSEARMFAENYFFCDVCGVRRPLGDRRRQISNNPQVGQALYVGALCCFEEGGGELDRDIHAAWVVGEAARLSAKELQPPMGTDGVYYPGTASGFFAPQSWITAFSVSPVVLTRGGAAQSLVLQGEGFTVADTFAYGNAGITDAAPPVLAGDSSTWTLDVQASPGMVPAQYRLTYNKDIFQGVFQVV